ncbi:MAG: beta-galactosidase [Victivallales bacterium]
MVKNKLWILLFSFLVFSTVQAAEPLVSWDCAAPAGIQAGEKLDLRELNIMGTGSDKSLLPLRILPPADLSRADACTVFWRPAADGSAAVCLAPEIATSIYPAAQRAAVIQCGSPFGAARQFNKISILLKFKLNDEMSWGGGGIQPVEINGILASIGPGLTLKISSRGGAGKNRRIPYLELKNANGASAVYSAESIDEVKIGQWCSFAMVWDGTAVGEDGSPSPNVRFMMDGAEFLCGRKAGAPAQVTQIDTKGPIVIGGDRGWCSAPIDLGYFAVYDEDLSNEDVLASQAFSPAAPGAGKAGRPIPADPAFSPGTFIPLAVANEASSWTGSAPGCTVSNSSGKVLSVNFTSEALGKESRILLEKPLNLDGAESINFWACLPVDSVDYGLIVKLIAGTADGKEILLGGTHFVSTHICPGNSRKCGLWMYFHVFPPKGKGISTFNGLSIKYESYGRTNGPKTARLLFKDFGLDRINYRGVPLYYVVSNYRDNFSMTSFNGAGGRAITNLDSGKDFPFVNLDNLVDQAKVRRPRLLNLCVYAYDDQDRLVHHMQYGKLKAAEASDFLQKIELPFKAPGTYRIKGKSYNSETGEYFTTDWVRLTIVRGKGSTADLRKVDSPGILDINQDKPFGRLEKTDNLEIAFDIKSREENELPFPLELKYAVIPYVVSPLWREPFRKVELDRTLAVEKAGRIFVPYEKKRDVELVIAELWKDGKKIDREERAIGVSNGIDATPGMTAKIPDMKGIGGADRIWMNSQMHALEEFCGSQSLEYVEKNIDEIRRITPNIGFNPELTRYEPIPGVYDWDHLKSFLDVAAAHDCRFVLYLSQKWPFDWASDELYMDSNGRVHNTGIVWGYLVGGHNYATGLKSPGLIGEFNRQLARKFINHPGFGAFYFENEHMVSDGSTSLPSSNDAGNKLLFRKFLSGKYKDIASLNKIYGTAYDSFDVVQIPNDNIVRFPRRIMRADLQQYKLAAAEDFVLGSQFNVVRKEDPVRPILVYHIGMTHPASEAFYRSIAENGGMMTNGGVHSTFDHDTLRESYVSVPGLLERMEPHDMWNYEPMQNGFDEMIFGMLAMGGRGINFHIFLPTADRGHPFSYDKYREPGKNGYYKILEKWNALKELRETEKLHDPVGIMNLRHAYNYIGGAWSQGIRPLMSSLYVAGHYEVKINHPGGNLKYLDDSKVLFLTGELIDKGELDFIKASLKKGRRIVLESTSARQSFEAPDEDRKHYLLEMLGVDPLSDGARIPEIKYGHDLYRISGGGEVLLFRSPLNGGQWNGIIPAIMAWAGIGEKMVDCDDPFMQMHVLKGNDSTYYIATTHRGYDPNAYDGPKEWNGKIRFLKPLPEGKYKVDEIWGANEENIGVMTPAELAEGFDAGKYTELQMKIFRLGAVKK